VQHVEAHALVLEVLDDVLIAITVRVLQAVHQIATPRACATTTICAQAVKITE